MVILNKLYLSIFIIDILQLILKLKATIIIPSIPHQHIGCWLRNLPKNQKQSLINHCNDSSSYHLFSIDNRTTDNSQHQIGEFCGKIISLLKNYEILPCWGYESDSNEKCLLYKPICDGSSNSWASNRQEQWLMFFDTADFGYVKQQKNELKYYCSPSSDGSSELKCTKYLRYCQAKNIFINFNNLVHLEEPIRYREDILQYGDIGGWNCNLRRNDLLSESGHKSPLMSWFAEISNFKNTSIEKENQKNCDFILEKPTFIMKLDATINMYHHFCDFINLYLTFHLNGSFNLDNQILIWDTYPYRSNFGTIWKSFTKNPLLNLQKFKGKTVCFKNEIIFPLLPRMVFGLYYNMPLIPGCSKSGIFRAFNRHLLHHLKLNDSETLGENVSKIKITFIKRNTQYRQILNQKQLLKSLEKFIAENEQKIKKQISVQLVEFNHQMPFIEQIKISSSTDILIGIHGAGLTHTLFQPDYGVLFELYNCEDPDCYHNLARLRGVHYLTWENPSKLKQIVDDKQKLDQKQIGTVNAKFVNYWFDPDEFIRLTMKAVNIVIENKLRFNQLKQNNFNNFNNHNNNNAMFNQKFKTEL